MFNKSFKPIDKLGRIVIPKDFRQELNLNVSDTVLLECENERIILTKAEQSCIFCSKTSDLRSYKGKMVCKRCAEVLGQNNT